MKTTGGGAHITRTKEIADILLGSISLVAILGALIGVLALPVYLTMLILDELSAPAWLSVAASACLVGAEFYGLALIVAFLDGLEDRESD